MKYIGNGEWLPGIPRRDLTADEVKELGRDYLLSTGLYAEKEKKPAKKAAAKKDGE